MTNKLAPRHLTMIAFGGLIGMGLLVGCGNAIHRAGPAIVLSILYAGLLTYCAMRTLSDYMELDPDRGSFLAYLGTSRRSAEEFVCGWLYCGYWTCVIAAEGLGGGMLLHQYLPLPVLPTSLALIAAACVLNLQSVRLFGQVEFWLTMIKLVAIIAFCAICLGAVLVTLYHDGGQILHGTSLATLAPYGIGAAFYSVPTIMFTMAGAEIITIAHRETEASSRTLSGLARLVTLRMVAFYLVPVILILLILPLSSVRPGFSPFADTLAFLHVPHGKLVFDGVILVTLLSCINSSTYIASRVLNELLTEDWPQGGGHGSSAPFASRILAVSVAGALLCLGATLFSAAAFSLLLDVSGYITIVVYGVISLSFIRFTAGKTLSPMTRIRAFAALLLSAGVMSAIIGGDARRDGIECFLVLLVLLSACRIGLARSLR
ncbi:amino acid permease [Acetobacter sp. TBRC 12305]|uniref:Amino acid permease n=1 Tax=Acetobacter garciniae TaxID=2817435 RepID=A0A939HLR1_9PROT|nr:amino acid permease [Acetobacter garciniae]MBO1325095.1 amino acid permease [Acetobacter garciniae]MBX0344934.1 amino acid permease [Acetobacter garciniae]